MATPKVSVSPHPRTAPDSDALLRDRLILVALLCTSFGGTWHAIRPDRRVEGVHPEATASRDAARDGRYAAPRETAGVKHVALDHPLADTALLDESPLEEFVLVSAAFDETPFYE